MKTITIGAAMLCATSLTPFAAPAFAQAAMTAAACQPLSTANLEACCAAEDWREIILPGDIAFCPPLSAGDSESGRLGQELADADNGGDPDPNGVDPDQTGSIDGNPGNTAEVGAAGEKGMDNESPATEATTGTKGGSNEP
jgi:hypothetical protein